MPGSSALPSLDGSPEVYAVGLTHARRGVRLQARLRILLVAFVALTLLILPPDHGAAACYVILVAYAGWAAAVLFWLRNAPAAVVRWAWMGLLVDLVTLAALCLVTGITAQDSWTADVLIGGLFLIPVLAATQLRPGICAAVVVPTVAVYISANAVTQAANAEPSPSILLRTLVLAGVGIGCIALSRIQRSRVLTIGGLVADRTELLDQLMRLEDHERRALSENLHDGALQYVLAARQDLDDLSELADSEAYRRIDHALAESSRLLRSTVSDLHPAVLDQVGLARALHDLARAAAIRGQFTVEVDVDDWPQDSRTRVDALLYSAARELLTNVAKHAGARSIRVVLGRYGPSARLVVVDDGRGIDDDELRDSVSRGHIGLRAHQLRVEAAGGALTVRPGPSAGTIATVDVPVSVPADGRADQVRAAADVG